MKNASFHPDGVQLSFKMSQNTFLTRMDIWNVFNNLSRQIARFL